MRGTLIRRATEISAEVLRKHAAEVDSANRFPAESIAALREAGLLALMVPSRFGGPGGTVRELAAVAAALGEECLSTALIWAMHSQQVAMLGAHAQGRQEQFLDDILRRGTLVASVTTEPERGSDVWTSACPLLPAQGKLRIVRHAPVVSYGAEAGLYLIKMLAGESRPPTDVVMVIGAPGDGIARVEGDWNSLGMRGTRSVPMYFELLVDEDRLLGRSFRALAVDTMVPVGYVAWSAAWLGAARGRYRAFVRRLREPRRAGRRNLNSDLLKHRLARMRLSLDLVEALLERVLTRIESLADASGDERRALQDEAYFILLNNLKLASSELSFAVVNELVEVAGMRAGYQEGDSLGLERVLRDIRSASLMYHNDQLLSANGTMILVEGSGLTTATFSAR